MTLVARILVPAALVAAGSLLALARPPAPPRRAETGLVPPAPKIHPYGIAGPAD